MQSTARYVRRHWAAICVVSVTLILYAVAWPTLHLTHEVSPPVMPLVSAAAVFPMLLVWVRPVLGWALTVATALVVPVFFDRVDGFGYPWQVVHIIVMLVLVAAVSVREDIRVVLAVWLATVLLFFGFVPGNDRWGWAIGITAVVAFGLLVRWLVISRRQLAHEEEVSELERARRAILEEKAHIARDLHDIVAHHMSMIVVQAQSAPYRLPTMTDEVRAEFDTIGTAAREALNDVRGLLGVLRSDGQLPESAPQPGLDRIADLFEASRRAGIRLDARTTGVPAGVTEAVGLTMYRILQESLTNSARHASGADVATCLDWGNGTVTISVTNGPGERGAPAPDHGGGTGIRGMAERAAAVGGNFVAHPRSDGGFEVRAVLPTLAA
ncbi:sensor histidine kinase [Rhodococcus sp. (in: high G+C Gram-positive bacteria)]|uniref:sensor histidine kinase n=1 Tax=Rhodococcus sp. TaxID=1831 RepID=UPI00388D97FF